MGLQGGAEAVSYGVRRHFLTFFNEVVSTLEGELGVGAARRGRGVRCAEQVLRDYQEGSGPIGVKDKKDPVGEGFYREVSPVLGRGPWVMPGEG